MFILQSICRGFFKVAAVAAILGHIGTVITTLISDAALSRRASQLNMERYRSGHNGTDSKSRVVGDGTGSKKPVFMRVRGSYFTAVLIFILQFSCNFAIN